MISILHPSRGRPQQAVETAMKWTRKKEGHQDGIFEYILTVDYNDPSRKEYFTSMLLNWMLDPFGPNPTMMIVPDSNNVVEATNYAASKSRGDVLLYLSDDFDCPHNWIDSVHEQFEGVTEPLMLKVDDCLQPFHVGVLTIPIMNRALYERLGYFWHPGYRSMFVDVDLYETCKKYGWLKYAPELKFPHNHCSVGKAPHDETYRRSEANWKQGQDFYNERKRLGFPL